MKSCGFWSGPGFRVGTYTDRTTVARTYLHDHGDQVAFVDLYEITLLTLGTVTTSTGAVSGLVLRHAAADFDVVFEGVLYAGGGANAGWRISRKQKRVSIGTGVEQLDLSILLDGADLLPPADGNSLTPRFGLGEAVHGGIFEGAHCTYRRLILPRLPSYPYAPLSLDTTTYGASIEFAGQITEAKIARSAVTLPVKTYLEKGAQSYPVNIYQATCINRLYGPNCKVSRTGSFGGNAFQFLGTIASWSQVDRLAIVDPIPSQPDDYFVLGTMQFTSGVLCGMSFPIVQHSGAAIHTLTTPPREPAVGDGVVVQAGCDKVTLLVNSSTGARTNGTCATKFNNLANARAFPHIPPPETAL